MRGQEAHAWSLFEVLLVIAVFAVVLILLTVFLWPQILSIAGNLGAMWRTS